MGKIVGCKVFSISTSDNANEDVLGKRITSWLEDNPFAVIEDREVVQSDTFISVLVFYSGKEGSGSPLG